MDNTNNKTGEQPVPSVSSPVGLGRQKEQEPSSVADIQLSQPEIELHEKVEKAGVEVVRDTMLLTKEHEAVGIQHAAESTPVHTKPLGTVKLPMSEEEALKTIKTTRNTDSRHWLAVLIEKICKAVKSLK